MRAVVHERYGTAEVLHVREVPIPVPNESQVLVRVHATSINSWDWEALQGRPRLTRLGTGLRRPKVAVLGGDVAGVVESVGPDVVDLRVGDEVFGDLAGGAGFGAFAEYVAAPARALAVKPRGMTFELAAAVPQAGLLALQGLRRDPPTRAGQRVLVNGGGGGAGTFAIQIAKHLGAEVTAVDRSHKVGTMRAVGADHVVDFTTGDYTSTALRYDLILDLAAHRPVREPRGLLTPDGRYVVVGGATGRIAQTVLYGGWTALRGQRKVGLKIYRFSGADLLALTALVQSGAVTPVIDSLVPLADLPDAMRRFGDGLVVGKCVISVP